METNSTDWAEVYRSLNIDSLKVTGKWMLIATLTVGFIVVIIAFLVFRKQPVIGIALAVGVLIFAGKFALGLLRMSKNPLVCKGIVTDKPQTSRSNETTFTEYVDYYLKLNVQEAFEINKTGFYRRKPLEKGKWKCSENLFNQVTKGDTIMVLIMPHDNHIARIIR
jgi:hypothetical protein